METIVDETIKVIAVFEGVESRDSGLSLRDSSPEDGTSPYNCGVMRPVKFKWRGRLYKIEEITYRWQSTEGSSTILHFSVSDGTALFELTCNKSSLKWRLDRIEA